MKKRICIYDSYISIYLYIYLPLSIHPSICLSVYMSIYLSIYLSVFLSACLSLYRSIYQTLTISIFVICEHSLPSLGYGNYEWLSYEYHLPFHLVIRNAIRKACGISIDSKLQSFSRQK